MPPSQNERITIGIMGLGISGDAVHRHFEKAGAPLRLYDPGRGLGSEEEINEADIVFVCVPTPYRAPVGFDHSAVDDAVSLLQGSKIVVIKSTVLPGTTEAYQARYSQHVFLCNPEFLREAPARQDALEPDRQIVGYTAQSRHVAERVLAMLPLAPYTGTMSARDAEMAKYMTNAFLALKVIFANEMYDLATALDVDYNVVREAVAADERIGDSHMDVLDAGYRGYGGTSLPKDTKALLDLAERMGVPLRLLRTADRVNATLLPPSEVIAGPTLRPIPLADEVGTDSGRDERAA